MSLRHRPWEQAADFAIGLKPIPLSAWLEGGEPDPAPRKDALFAAARELVWAETEGSRPAQAEAAALVAAALGPAPIRDDAERADMIASENNRHVRADQSATLLGREQEIRVLQ